MKRAFIIFILLFYVTTSTFAQSKEQILIIPANPKAGFQWDYAIYLPRNMDVSKKLPILFIMNNTGSTELSIEETEQKTLENLRYQDSAIADELGVPLVMPMVQRLPKFYTHDLSRAVFVSQNEKFKHLDEQILHMLQDARKQLKKYKIRTQKKFLVAGFSAAGVFAWRWTMLHPEYVLATVTGGALYHMLPMEEWDGEKLIYPVGVGDLEEHTGKKFNKKAWLHIPIFSTNGELDDNDTFVYNECFNEEEERPILEKVLPGKDIFERRAQSIKLLNEMAPNVQTHLYPFLTHEPVTQDSVAFLKLHRNGGPLKSFTPTDTGAVDKVSVQKIIWGNDDSLASRERKLLGPNYLLLEAKSNHPSRYYGPYEINILQNGKKLFSKKSNGSISDDSHILLLYYMTEEDMTQLRGCGKKQKFTISAKYPQYLDISQKLTFTVSTK